MTIFDVYVINFKNIAKAIGIILKEIGIALLVIALNMIINLTIPVALMCIFARWWLIFSAILTYPFTSIWFEKCVKKLMND